MQGPAFGFRARLRVPGGFPSGYPGLLQGSPRLDAAVCASLDSLGFGLLPAGMRGELACCGARHGLEFQGEIRNREKPCSIYGLRAKLVRRIAAPKLATDGGEQTLRMEKVYGNCKS